MRRPVRGAGQAARRLGTPPRPLRTPGAAPSTWFAPTGPTDTGSEATAVRPPLSALSAPRDPRAGTSNVGLAPVALPASAPSRPPGAGGPGPLTGPFAEPQQAARRPGDVADPDTSAPAGERVRVVLSERRRPRTPVRTVEIVQEGTGVGRLLRSSLIRSQLVIAVGFAAAAALTLGALPLLFVLFPVIGRAEVFGLRLPWLMLGLLVYPFLLGLGWWHTRTAENVEQNFADHVQD
ncbi:hypothetical protein [Pseudonocardia sp.]|uniref:hypothetical protein n=1 Tax=Pseudonocardia sp. TaxID=60912 RepID=UPI003D151DDD